MSGKDDGDGHPFLKWLPLGLAVIAGVAAWADLRSDVDNLEKQFDRIESRPEVAAAPLPLVTGRVTKGDLCRELFSAITRSSQKDKLDRLTKEIGKLDCYEGVAAMYVEAEPGQAAAVNALLKEPRQQPNQYPIARPPAPPPNR